MPSPETSLVWIAATALVAVLAFGAGMLWRSRRETGHREVMHLPQMARSRPMQAAVPGDDRSLSRRLGSAFLAWLAEQDQHENLWAAFDQLLREVLSEELGAARVRGYHVEAGRDTLQPISLTGRQSKTPGPSARAGVLGHVATSGNEFVASEGTGPLLDDLAARTGDGWHWVWPVRQNQTTIGLLAVGTPRHPNRLTKAIRVELGQLITLFWQHVRCLERLRIAERTDRATGVLTRNDFFSQAEHALADSYQENEPVVVAVLALEGLRGLDDAGHWHERDALIEQLGLVLARRVRSDDLVGRFADDRFVILLRRLDSGLGQIIAEKMLTAGRECLERLDLQGVELRLRCGLVGSGFAQPPLDRLLVSAFEAVDQARRRNVELVSDIPQRRPAGAQPAEVPGP